MTFHDNAHPMPEEMRNFPRYTQQTVGEFHGAHGDFPCKVFDISAGGVELEITAFCTESVLSDTASILLPGIGIYAARRIWRAGLRAAYFFEMSEQGRHALADRLAVQFNN